MDAVAFIAFVLFGAAVGLISGLVNILLWKRTISHNSIFGIKVHNGFGGMLQEILNDFAATDIAQLESKILALFDNFMATGLTQKMPVLNMFIDEKLIDEIRVVFHAEMSANLPQLLKSGLSGSANTNGIDAIASKAMQRIFKRYSKHIVIYLLIGTAAGALLGMGFYCLLSCVY
jgi:hypothetical protein